MPRVLIIDEPSLVSDLERSFVRRDGFQLRTASNGRGILENAAGIGPDLIIASARMSDMAAWDLCAALQMKVGTASIPVLIIGPSSEREQALRSGARAFLTPPWTRSDLLACVRKFLPLEARGAARANVSLKVVCGEGRESYVAFTRDISATGLFLKGASLAEPGTRLSLRFRLPGDVSEEEVRLSAEVVRCVPQTGETNRLRGLGVRFLDFPLIRKIPITKYVREHSAD